MHAVIKQFGTDYPYKMEVFYHPKKGLYILSFACMKHGINKGEEHACSSFEDALRRFNSNCRYYGIPEQYLTEEEFLGLKNGTLYPISNKETRNGCK